MIDIKVLYQKIIDIEAGVFLVPFFEGEKKFGFEGYGDLESYLSKAVIVPRGKRHEPLYLLNSPEGHKTSKILAFCLGERRFLTPLVLKEAFGGAYRGAQTLGFNEACLLVPKWLEDTKKAELAFEGYLSASYSFEKYKSEPKEFMHVLKIVPSGKNKVKPLLKTAHKVCQYSNVVFRIRDIVNEPSNILTPDELVKKAIELRKSGIRVSVIEGDEISKKGLNALKAVGQGSKKGAMLITLEYAPKGAKRKIVIAGKGVTFDTGGYSLKDAKHMLHMKGDMLGAAIVLETMRFLSFKKSPMAVVGMIPVAENLVSETAYKPDDIIRTHSGKTVEIENTDGEGRLILADALSYSRRFDPDEIIDIGTISGSAASIGSFVAPFTTNSQRMASRFEKASYESGETFVRLPHVKEYARFLKSSVADMKNLSMGSCGSLITAPVFLSSFVGDSDWMHIELAGVDFAESDASPIYPRGSTAFGTKTVLKYLGLI